MGIKNLLKFLSDYPDIIKNKVSKDFFGEKIAIDISILIYQVVIAIRNSGSDLTNNKGEITSHILGLFNKTIGFLDKGILPIYVFDGKPPKLKQKVLNVRKQIKNNSVEKLLNANNDTDKIKYLKKCVNITKEQLNQCRELLTLMGIPYIDAPEEADSELSYLCKEKLVYAVLTEDMDILTFGSPKIIKNLTSHKKHPLEIDLNNILKQLDLTYEQFIELCILFGCDYCHNLTNIKYDVLFETYSKHKNIENTIIELRNNGYIIPNNFEYIDAKQYFINSIYNPVEKSHLQFKKPNNDKLIEILVEKYGFIKHKLVNKINKLNKYYEKFKD